MKKVESMRKILDKFKNFHWQYIFFLDPYNILNKIYIFFSFNKNGDSYESLPFFFYAKD